MDENFLTRMTQIADPSYMRPSAPNQSTRSAEAPKRERMSTIDVIGGLLDSFAVMGGSEPGYRPTLDARDARERQAEEDQMKRQLFPVELQKGVLGNQKTQQEMMYDQNEVLGQAASYVQRAYANGGVEGARNVFHAIGPRIMTPEQWQGEMQQFEANPEGYVSALSVFTGSGDEEFGTTVYYDKDAEGNLYPYQVSKSGGKKYLNSPDGRTPAPLLSIQDTGLGFQSVNRHTALPYGAPVNKTGDLEKGIVLEQTPEGPRAAPLPGGEMDNEINKEVRDLQTLDNALTSFEGIFPEVRGNIDAMAKAGSLSGVPEDAVDAEGQPLQGGSNLGAIAMQNIPLLEQATNKEGFSARQQIDSIGRTMIQQLGPLLTQAQNSGANLTSRMMDTPKELEGLLAQVINTKDYRAAVKAYDRFKTRYNEVRGEVQDKIKATQARTARGRQQAPASGSTRIRYDAQGNRIQ